MWDHGYHSLGYLRIGERYTIHLWFGYRNFNVDVKGWFPTSCRITFRLMMNLDSILECLGLGGGCFGVSVVLGDTSGNRDLQCMMLFINGIG
jgi:hypothetical protein